MYYSIALGAIIVASIISTIGGVVFLTWNLTWPAIIFVLVISAIVSAFVLRYIFEKNNAGVTIENNNRRSWSLGLIPFLILISICFILLWRGRTDVATNTPWALVPNLFWVALVLAVTTGATLLLKARRGVVLIVIMGLISLGMSIAPLLYVIGYGYDPLIHQAAEQHIFNFGSIAPKTPYYAGQYALVVIMSKLTTLPIHFVDVWLLPLLATLGISSMTIFAATTLKRPSGQFVAGVIAVLPLAMLVNTTPFSLACLFALFAAIMGLVTEVRPRLKLAVWIFAAAALACHPMAGVPAIVLAGLIQFKKNTIRVPIAISGALGVPILFAIVGKGFSFSLARISDLAAPFELPLSRFHALGDVVYALGAIATTVIVITMIAKRAYLLAFISTILSGLIMAMTIDFSYLPYYEQSGYTNRLFVVALLLAVPASALAVGKFFERAMRDSWRMFMAIAGITLFFTGGLYLAFPRSDAYVLSKGWNTSSADIKTVHAINNDAGKEPYIVLAAQPVSAAALREFGFFKYFDTKQGQVFAYNIPTGGALYQFYLKMFYTDPTAETMKQAMELAGVKRGYFVVSQYWTGSDHIISRAKATSEKYFSIDAQDTVFRYSR